MPQPDSPRQPDTIEAQLRDEHLRGLGLMLSSFAHELNTPVGVIASMCDGLTRCHDKISAILAKPTLDADDLEALRQIMAHMDSGRPVLSTGIERIQALVRELRLAGRPEGAEPAVPVDVVEVIEGDLLLLHHLTRQGVTVHRHFESRPMVMGRPAMLGQVFLNLLRNAVEAVAGQGTIEITIGEADGQARVVVADDGPGLPEDVLARLFTEACTTKCPETGTGLGLLMSHKVLAKYEGTLTAANRSEGGAMFTVTLPLA